MQLGTSLPGRTPRTSVWLLVAGLLIATAVATSTGVVAQAADAPGTEEPRLGVGVPTAYVSPDGSASIVLTVERIIDPYEVSVEARDGERYVAIELRLENTGETEPSFYTNYVRVVDSTSTAYLGGPLPSRSLDAIKADPDFNSGDPYEPGSSTVGLLFYGLPVDAAVEGVIFTPPSYEWVPLSEYEASPADPTLAPATEAPEPTTLPTSTPAAPITPDASRGAEASTELEPGGAVGTSPVDVAEDDVAGPATAGEPYLYEASDGSESIRLTVHEIIDPYDVGISAFDVDRLSAEQRRYVAVRLEVENAASTPIPYFHESYVQILDDATTLHGPLYVGREAPTTEEDPALPAGELAPDASNSGLVFYELPQAVMVEAVMFTPTYDRLIRLAWGDGHDPSARHVPDSDDNLGADAVEEWQLLESDAAGLQGSGWYEAQRFGHGVTWDASSWLVRELHAGPDFEHLVLTNEATAIELEGLGDLRGDARRCLEERVHADLDRATGFDAAPADALPPTSDGVLPRSAGLYLYLDDDDGRSREQIRYVECRVLEMDEAVLRIVVTAPARYWATDRDLVAGVLAAIELPGWSPEPPVGALSIGSRATAPQVVAPVFCADLVSRAELETALAVWERIRLGLDGDTLGIGTGEICDQRIASDERFIFRFEPGDPADFAPGTELLGAEGRPIPAIGDEALLFGATDGTSGTSILSVFERRDVGDLHFRLTLGRPDLDGASRSLVLADLARRIISRFPGVPERRGVDSPVVKGLASAYEEDGDDLSDLDFVSNLLAKEDAGEWPRDEGLVATLRLFAHEADAADVLRDIDNTGWEATGLLELATDYLEDGPDTEAKTEITRLVDELVWTTDELEAMAGIPPPDAVAGGRLASIGSGRLSPMLGGTWTATTGLVGVADVRTALASDALCSSFFGGPQRGMVGPCLEWRALDTASPDQGTYRLFVPSPLFPQGGWQPEDYEIVFAAFERFSEWFETEGKGAARSAGSPGRMMDVDVVVTIQPRPPGKPPSSLVRGQASRGRNADGKDTCQVRLYPRLQRASDGIFQQVVAHELAHCLQYSNFPRQFRADSDARRWWVEGTAEYLSNLAYPDVDKEWTRESKAYRISRTNSLLDLSYATFLFWQFLEDELGLDGIFSLILSMPEGGGWIQQAEALAGFEGMGMTFQAFLEAMIDGDISDTHSGRKNRKLSYKTTLIDRTGSQTLEFRPFTTSKIKLTVEKCKVATLEAELGTGRDSARVESDVGAWEELPQRLPVRPGAARDRIHATTAADSAEVTVRVSDLRDDEDDPECAEEPSPQASGRPDRLCVECDSSGFFRFVRK